MAVNKIHAITKFIGSLAWPGVTCPAVSLLLRPIKTFITYSEGRGLHKNNSLLIFFTSLSSTNYTVN